MNTSNSIEDFSNSDMVTPVPGFRLDEGKCRLELIPSEVLFALGTVLGDACKEGGKYPEYNWAAGMKWSRCFGAMMRHMWAWWAGRAPSPQNFLFGSLDPETSYSHLWHALCCLTFLVAYEERAVGTDDRYKG